MNLKWYSSGKFCKLLLAVSMQHLVWVLSYKQTVHAKACQSSPLKCFSRQSWRLACVLEHNWLTASCFFISPVMALPRLSSSAEWYLRHKLLRFSWVELMFLCWLWSSFCISYGIKVYHEDIHHIQEKYSIYSTMGLVFKIDAVEIHSVICTLSCDFCVCVILWEFCPVLLGNNYKQLLRGS